MDSDSRKDMAELLVSYCDPGEGIREAAPSGVSWRRWGSVSSDTPATLVIGAFDGMHAGHQRLVSWAREDAATRGEPVVAVTFTPTPKEFFNAKGARGRLLDDADRVAALLCSGVDAVIAFEFTPEFAAVTCEAFVDERLLAAQATSAVHVGDNFSFGSGGSGNPRTLAELAVERGFTCTTHALAEVTDGAVSSTRVRRLLDQGRVADAVRLLGRYHFVRGSVVHGRGQGTGFGFATANVEVSGVFWPAAVNVGEPRSFEDAEDDDSAPESFLEAHLLGFSGDLYGHDVSVHFVAWLRHQRTFDSLDELKATVAGNIAWVREHLGDTGVEISQ